MANGSEDARKKAEARLVRAREGAKAMEEHQAEGAAVRARTSRLRELRLAKEAGEAAKAAEAPVKKPRKK